MSREISRRTFIKGAAAAGVVLAAGSYFTWNGRNIPEKVQRGDVTYDVLIIGSGMTYHNMQTMMASMRGGGVDVGSPDPGSQRFDAWLEEVLTKATPENRINALAAWHKVPAARDAHPREEHLLPLHVSVGAAGTDPGRKTLTDVVMGAVESAFRFG